MIVSKNNIVTRQKKSGIERLHDNFKVIGSISKYINGIVMYAKGM
jgi:hypothetical protein